MNNKRIRFAVTGASGFIGSNMVEYLKKKRFWVRAITSNKKTSQEKHLLADELISGDLRKSSFAVKSLKNIDYLFHFACNMGGVGFFYAHNFTPFMDNMRIDLNILEAAQLKGLKRIFYAASACVYPTHLMKSEGMPIKLTEAEIIPANSNQMYGWEKLIMLLLAKEAPIEVRVGIFDTIFGAAQPWEGERAKFPPSIVAKVIRSSRNGKPIEIWGNGKQVRSFLYIADALEKMFEIMMSKRYYGEVNITSDESVIVKDCADWVCNFAGIKPRYIYNEKKPTGVVSRGLSTEKFKKNYKYRDKISTKEGFRLLFNHLNKVIPR